MVEVYEHGIYRAGFIKVQGQGGRGLISSPIAWIQGYYLLRTQMKIFYSHRIIFSDSAVLVLYNVLWCLIILMVLRDYHNAWIEAFSNSSNRSTACRVERWSFWPLHNSIRYIVKCPKAKRHYVWTTTKLEMSLENDSSNNHFFRSKADGVGDVSS